MYQIDNSTAAATMPASTVLGTPGYFTDGNAVAGSPATIVPAEWLNAIQTELGNIVTFSGQTLQKNKFNQVAQAIQSNQLNYAVGTGITNACAASFSPAIAAVVDGLRLDFIAAASNTGACTFAPNTLAAQPIVNGAYGALVGGEIVAGSRVSVIWNSRINAWVLISGTSSNMFLATGAGAIATTLNIRGNALKYVTDYDNLTDAKAASGVGMLYDPNQGKMWVLGGGTPIFDEAVGTMGRLIAFDGQGSTPNIPANSSYYGIRASQSNGQPNGFTIGSGSIMAAVAYYLKSLVGSDPTSNMYGVIGNVENAGPGTTKSIYGRGVVDAGCTGVVMGITAGVTTNASATPSHLSVCQLTADTVSGTVVNELINCGSSQTVGYVNYGILLNSNIQVATSGFKMFAGGAGDFLTLQNAAGSASLFRVDAAGEIVMAPTSGGAISITGLQIARSDANGNFSVLCGSGGTLYLGTSGNTPLYVSAGIVNVDNASGHRLNFTGAGATTVGATGSAPALPANPLGYVQIQVNGTTVKIPYYNN